MRQPDGARLKPAARFAKPCGLEMWRLKNAHYVVVNHMLHIRRAGLKPPRSSATPAEAGWTWAESICPIQKTRITPNRLQIFDLKRTLVLYSLHTLWHGIAQHD